MDGGRMLPFNEAVGSRVKDALFICFLDMTKRFAALPTLLCCEQLLLGFLHKYSVDGVATAVLLNDISGADSLQPLTRRN